MVSYQESVGLPPPAIVKRRARNRLAQRSFRERQARYVKELEQKIAGAENSSPQCEGSRLQAADQEIHRLREALQATKSRILGLSTALAGIADNIDASLNAPSSSDSNQVQVSSPKDSNDDQGATTLLDHPYGGQLEFNQEGVVEEEQRVGAAAIEAVLSQATDRDCDPPNDISFNENGNVEIVDISSQAVPVSSSEPQQAWRSQDERTSWAPGPGPHNVNTAIPDTFLISPDGLPRSRHGGRQVRHHTYGPPYNEQESVRWPLNNSHQESALASIPFFSQSPDESLNLPIANVGSTRCPPSVTSFPSVFSAHLAVCEYFMTQNQAYRDRLQPKGSAPFAKLTTTMVNMFVDTCWPGMRVWWAYIQSSAVVEKLLRWRLDPCFDTYDALPVTHRPTALQLCRAHPAIIDWAFFPSIRDRMIEVYSHSPLLDEVVCELVKAYVVEADLTKIMTGMENQPPQTGYFSIWDIVQTIAREDVQATRSNVDLWGNAIHLDEDLFAEPPSPFDIEQPGTDGTWIKVPLDQIYQSRKTALKLFKLLRMDDRQTVKVDPVFAAAHPELCDDFSIIATGLDCTLRKNNSQVPRPQPLTREAITTYKMMLWKTNM